jgi:hypothetical protein
VSLSLRGSLSTLTIRTRQGGLLIKPLARTLRWSALIAMGVAASLLVFMTTGDTADRTANLGERILALRLAAVLIAFGVAFVLDDPAADSTAHLPTQPLYLRALRAAVAAPAVAVAWWVALASPRTPVEGFPVPVAALTVELCALAVAVLALSAIAVRFVPERLGGVAAAPTLLGVVGAAVLLPARFGLFPGNPADPAWHGADVRWRFVLAGAVLALVMASRDPGRRTLWARLSRILRRSGSGGGRHRRGRGHQERPQVPGHVADDQRAHRHPGGGQGRPVRAGDGGSAGQGEVPGHDVGAPVGG